jgi:hypothetical protein
METYKRSHRSSSEPLIVGAFNLKNSVRLVLVRLVCCLPALLSTVLGMALPSSRAHAQITKVGSAYQFRVKYHKGMKIKYLMKVTTTLPTPPGGGKAQSIEMTIPVDGTVTDVQNKIATIQMVTGPMTMNGRPQGTQKTLTMKLDDRGKPVGGMPTGMENLTASLPDKPLKVGDTYSSKQDITMANIPISVNAVYKFTGVKSVAGHQLATFTVTLNGSGSVPTPQGATASFTTKGTGQMSLSTDDGLATRTSIDQDVVIPQGAQTLKLTTKTVLVRQ